MSFWSCLGYGLLPSLPSLPSLSNLPSLPGLPWPHHQDQGLSCTLRTQPHRVYKVWKAGGPKLPRIWLLLVDTETTARCCCSSSQRSPSLADWLSRSKLPPSLASVLHL